MFSGIRRLQLILLKVSLLLGVQVYPKCGFCSIVEPTDGKYWCNKLDRIVRLDLQSIVFTMSIFLLRIFLPEFAREGAKLLQEDLLI